MLTYMGIDLGTTSVKVCIVKDGTQVATISKSTNADIKSSLGSSGYEQDAAAILATTQSCLKGLSQETLASVQKICITGQMHGVILWSSTKTNTFYNRDRNEFDITKVSPLYTWQDQRCTEEFLSSLPKPVSHLSLSTGHGNATLFWLSTFQLEFLSGYDRAGTVMDFLISVLCGLDSPIMSTQLAASWGYFNCSAGCWNKEVLEQTSFPFHLLPQVVEPGGKAGNLQFDWFAVKKGTPVLVALGIHNVPCTQFYRTHMKQLAFPEFLATVPSSPDPSSPVQYFPYFNNQYLAVAASLNGGNVLSHFVNMIQNWMGYLGLVKSDKEIWKTLLESPSKSESNSIQIIPTIFGERHAPSQRGEVTGITAGNMDLHHVFQALCKGLVENLTKMMSPSFLKQKGIHKLLGTGSVIHKNPIIQREVMTQYGGLNIELGGQSDSAFGAALFCEASDKR